MSDSDDGDELIARVAGIEPARGMPPLSKSSLHNLVGTAIAPQREARTWTWPRYRLASTGALLGSGALVIAGILGLDAAGTSLPVASSSFHRTAIHPPVAPPSRSFALGYMSTESDVNKAAQFGGYAACPVTLQLHATSATSIARGPGHADATLIVSWLSPRLALGALAPGFGLTTTRVMWYPRGAHARAWWVGSLDGPSLTTFSSLGITWWSYAGAREPARKLLFEAGPHGRHLFSDVASSRDAAALLSRLRVGGHLGSPVAWRSATTVQVSLPITVHGLASDERFDVTYGARGRLAAAEGPLVTIGRQVAYPTISAWRAAQLLRRPAGALMDVVAPNATTTRARTVGRSVPTAVCGVPSDVIPVSGASMTLSTRELSNGRVWLLPSWTFSGSMKSVIPSANAVTWVAISPKFLDYGPALIRYRHHRAKH